MQNEELAAQRQARKRDQGNVSADCGQEIESLRGDKAGIEAGPVTPQVGMMARSTTRGNCKS